MLASDYPAPVGSPAWIAAHDAALCGRMREAYQPRLRLESQPPADVEADEVA